MRTGKLAICRGHQVGEAPPAAPRLSLVPRERQEPAQVSVAPPPPVPTDAVSPRYLLVHDRLTAYERLARLHAKGKLSDEEFAAEKVLLRSMAIDELPLIEPMGAPRAGPSLVGRMFAWKLVPLGLAAGLALSFASQPRETMRFFEESLRLLGA